MDQVAKIIYSGLYADAAQIYCFLTGGKDNIDQIKRYFETLPKKFKIEAVGIDDKTYERFTLNRISNLVRDNDKFLYIHSKGVSRVHGKITGAEPIHLWRNYMEYYLIANYKKCLEKLATHDIVGVAYKDVQIGPHFSGNFWWSTGSYYKKLSAGNTIGQHYNDPEAFIFKGGPKHNKLDGDSVANMHCLYTNPMYPRLYVDKTVA